MAKKPAKVIIEKKAFDLDSFLEQENLNTESKDKELTWIPLSKAWFDALKLPGFPRGFLSLVRGFSNTGKSTAVYEAIAGAQKIGDFPIVIETEGNWNVEHAKMVGVKFKEVLDKETGEMVEKPDNFILVKSMDLYNMYKYYNHKEGKLGTKVNRLEPVIEDVALFINEMLRKQEEGNLPFNLVFIWDSIGTLSGYQMASSDNSNNQWNASAMNAFGSISTFKIPSSRSLDSEYTNTMICVQKIWLDNINGTVIKHKGGETMFFNARLIVHLGGILTHGTKKLTAKALNQDFQFGTEVKIRCEKNHVTGIERNGVIASTPHGYVNPEEIDEYKKEHRQFIHDSLNVGYDADIEYITEGNTED